ncbi:nadA: quinolinate synthetase complex, A subunit [Rubrobacter radiotolerans]|uniref:Quinolinate synthase n=1 Tax=Rubrobacter radiotolerans TaxID=42256 RepID=A0A023WZI2_RUBRA|nr:quinolinate synthase NadA [Rubrobacter radiotolerans]AHY45371.1 nadA: quinolinate synthetase complex, A subunit [Rubrobacter radiotolerans]MDX5892782.1 quinolinate synthase NadA [Rubrobacter radiotolerans]SMC02486.1 quinolinate synthetase [Rubrobacter radiotolerans DSM 5868]
MAAPAVGSRAGILGIGRGSEARLAGEIERLKGELNAVVLAHYYQEPGVQDVADYIGDSLGLAREAQATEAEVIVFCGVHFMAETAKILNPEKTVVLPDLEAGCSLSDSCPPEEFRRFVEARPDHAVVSYVNTSAAVKALSDVICTSSNAERVIASIPEGTPIIFGPDRHLGRYVAKKTGREMVLWPGSCIVHVQFSEKKIRQLKVRHPEAEVLAHPECEDRILALADHVGSTTALLERTRTSPAQEFIVATETGIIHQMKKASPEKRFIPAPGDGPGCEACSECPHMRRNTLEKLARCMRDLAPRIELDESVRLRALAPIERMLEIG